MEMLLSMSLCEKDEEMDNLEDEVITEACDLIDRVAREIRKIPYCKGLDDFEKEFELRSPEGEHQDGVYYLIFRVDWWGNSIGFNLYWYIWDDKNGDEVEINRSLAKSILTITKEIEKFPQYVLNRIKDGRFLK